MSVSDPVADYLTRIRNAISAGHESVNIPASRVKLEMTRILKEEGYIQNYKHQEHEKQGVIRILLKYVDGSSVITGLNQVSRPGRRIYCDKEKIPVVIGGLGISIVSTSRGIMTGGDCRKSGVGGEVLCKIW